MGAGAIRRHSVFFIYHPPTLTFRQGGKSNSSNDNGNKKKKKDGYNGTRRCYLERRRGMGPDGNDTHYIVYAEDSLDMLIAATSTPSVGVYYFSEKEDDFLRHGDNYIGMMKSTMAGTQFHLVDDGIR